MTISVERWADHDIQDTTYVALLSIEGAPFSRASEQTQVQPAGSWGRHIRTNMRPRGLSIDIEIISGDLNTAQRQLSQWFAPGTTGELEISEDGTAKVVDAVCSGFQRYAGSTTRFLATLIAADPRWRARDFTSSARGLTASGQSWSFNNAGNSAIDDPIITIRSTTNKAAASGYLYKLESIIAWRAERPSGLYAVELTEGWDHATEVGASRSQSDADDVRVLVDGVEVPRWIGENAATDANSAATNIWANLTFSPRKIAVSSNALTLASPGPDGDLIVTKGGTLGWPRQGALLIDDEVITYTGRTESNADGYAAFQGITRGARNTTVATHSASTTVYWIEHRVQIVYGNTGASAPDARADLKPLLDLTSSTLSNVRHEWINFADDTYPGRSMQWGRRNRTFDDQYDKILAPGGSPASALTWEYQSGGAVSGKPNYNTWYREFPTGTGGSGGNVASLTRTLADTLGMWVYGIDDAGQEVVLDKYAGALTSASANITQPTNPVYRLECWAFNQVIAGSPVADLTATAHGWPIAAFTILTGSPTNFGQQVVVGDQPLELLAMQFTYVDATGGRNVFWQLAPDNSGVPGTYNQASAATVTAASGDYQQMLFSYSSGGRTFWPLSAGESYWWSATDIAATPTTSATRLGQPYNLSYYSSAAHPEASYEFRWMGRPAGLATAFERCDNNCYADNGDQVTVDGVTIHLSSTESPYVALKSRQSIYRFVNGTLYNETTGQSVKLTATCGVGNDLVIDIGAGTAVNADDENGTSFMPGVEYSDPAGKFTLVPGDNSLRFVEAGLAGVNIEVSGYARWE